MATEPKQQLATIDVGTRGLMLTNLDQMWRFAQVAVQSGMCPKGIDTPQKAMICLQAGAEVGLPAWASLRQVAVINNRPCLWGDGFLGAVQSKPICEWIEEKIEGDGDKMVAICSTHRRGTPKPITRTFSVEDAKKAKLWSKPGPWQDYPKRMLQMRARAFCLRDAYSDILSGMPMVEEMMDITDYKQVEVSVTDAPPKPSTAERVASIIGNEPVHDIPCDPIPDAVCEDPPPEETKGDLLKCPRCNTNMTWSEALNGAGCPACDAKGIPAE